MEKEKYISLITEKLNDNISTKNEKILNDWLAKSEENNATYTEIESIWEKTQDFNPEIVNEEEDSWQKIQSKITETKMIKMPTRRFSYLKIASVVVVLLSMGILWNTILNNNDLIIESTLANEIKKITLPDGSQVDLNENSQITYSANFDKRDIKLEGEAFFEVVKNPERPFKVKANNTETIVLGTSFNLNSNKSIVDLTLYTGKVKFVSDLASEILLPGENIIFKIVDKEIIKKTSEIENDIAWKTKKLTFKNTDITTFKQEIEDYFNISIYFKKVDNTCTFTGTFQDAELIEVLEAISYTYDSKYKFKNNVYYFEKLICEK